MSSIENLRIFKDMFDKGLSGVSKAVQIGYLLKNINRNKLKTNANYRSLYNNIIRTHYTNQNKFQLLMNIEKTLNNNKNTNYTKYAFNSVDWELVKRNADYRALYNRVANKAKLKSISVPGIPNTWNIKTRRQQGNTCWFHSIINGLLLSPRPRALMKKLVADVPEIRVSDTICPSKKAGRQWFLGYIKHRLQGFGPVHSVFKNRNVIRASGLRGFSTQSRTAQMSVTSIMNIELGSIRDLVWFYNTFFPGEFTNRNGTSTPLFVMKHYGKVFGTANPEVPHVLIRNGLQYELTHAYLSFWTKPLPEGHSVTGYKSRNGSYYIYDSELSGQTIYIDWTKKADVTPLAEFYKQKFGYNIGGLSVHAIYMKKNNGF